MSNSPTPAALRAAKAVLANPRIRNLFPSAPIPTEEVVAEAIDAEFPQAWDIAADIESLVADEGSSVQILCPNPDFNGLPNRAIIVQAMHTEWKERRYEGDTLRICFDAALKDLNRWTPSIARITRDRGSPYAPPSQDHGAGATYSGSSQHQAQREKEEAEQDSLPTAPTPFGKSRAELDAGFKEFQKGVEAEYEAFHGRPMPIQRYKYQMNKFVQGMVEDSTGIWVRHSDHLAHVAKLTEEGDDALRQLRNLDNFLFLCRNDDVKNMIRNALASEGPSSFGLKP